MLHPISSYPDIQNKQILQEISDKSLKDVVDEFVNIVCEQIRNIHRCCFE